VWSTKRRAEHGPDGLERRIATAVVGPTGPGPAASNSRLIRSGPSHVGTAGPSGPSALPSKPDCGQSRGEGQLDQAGAQSAES